MIGQVEADLGHRATCQLLSDIRNGGSRSTSHDRVDIVRKVLAHYSGEFCFKQEILMGCQDGRDGIFCSKSIHIYLFDSQIHNEGLSFVSSDRSSFIVGLPEPFLPY